MVWCAHCAADVEVDHDEAGAVTCCGECGRVLEDTAFSSDVTFVKGADGEGELVGQFVSETGAVRGLQRMAGGKVWSMRGDSHEVSLSKGRHELSSMIDHFVIRPANDCLEAAHRLYRLAVQAGFTKGRLVPQVAACCLYIICRQESKPFMLMDLSDLLQVNVYKLGAVYLQLMRLLHVEDHPSLTRPIDPSLYMHRFAEQLLADKKDEVHRVTTTALRLVGQMKRDWMQTGRRPAGVCGAALWMACHMHSIVKTKADVMAVVHVGWCTLDKRVREFSNSAASALTPREFEAQAAAAEAEQEAMLAQLQSREHLAAQQRLAVAARSADGAGPSSAASAPAPALPAVVCDHIAEGVALHAAMGMCADCFKHFLATSGGIWGVAANPPAFQRALDKAQAEADAAAAAAGLEPGPDLLALDGPAPSSALVPSPAVGGPGAPRSARRPALAARRREGEAQVMVGGLLMPLPAGHGLSDEDIMAEMAAEEARNQALAGATGSRGAAAAAAAAAALAAPAGPSSGRSGGRGRGRGRGRGGGRGAAAGAPVTEQEVAQQVAELDAALGQLHDAVCHSGPEQAGAEQLEPLPSQQPAPQQQPPQPQQLQPQQQQQLQPQQPAAELAHVPADSGGSAGHEPGFGASLLGYGSGSMHVLQSQARHGQPLEQAEQQQHAEQPPSKRPRLASQGPSQPMPGTPSQRRDALPVLGTAPGGGAADDDRDAFAAALAGTATEGLGLGELDVRRGRLIADAVSGGLRRASSPDVGALVPLPPPELGGGGGEPQDQARRADPASGRGGEGCGEGEGGAAADAGDGAGAVVAAPMSEDTDLEGVDDDEIDGYIRPEAEVKIKEMIWNGLHKDWIKAQRAKKAAAEAAAAQAAAAEAVAAENEAAVAASAARSEAPDAEEPAGAEGGPNTGSEAPAAAAAAAAGAGAGRRRGKPGPKRGSTQKRPTPLPEADSASAAARANVEATKRLSDKINYRVLDDLFEATAAHAAQRPASAAAAAGAGGTAPRRGRSAGPAGARSPAAAAAAAGPSFAEAKAREAQQRKAVEDQAAARAQQQLEAEARRRGAAGGLLGGLGGLGLPPLPAGPGADASTAGGGPAARAKPSGSGRLGSLARPSGRLGTLRR